MFSNPADIELLLNIYDNYEDEPDTSPVPWSWHSLSSEESTALVRLCESFIEDYNAIFVSSEEEIIPACWLLHPELATEIPIQLWLYYASRHGTKATLGMAGEYHARHLPGFRSRIEKMLGQQPKECRKGNHHTEWRSNIDTLTHNYQPMDNNAQKAAITALQKPRFGGTS